MSSKWSHQIDSAEIKLLDLLKVIIQQINEVTIVHSPTQLVSFGSQNYHKLTAMFSILNQQQILGLLSTYHIDTENNSYLASISHKPNRSWVRAVFILVFCLFILESLFSKIYTHHNLSQSRSSSEVSRTISSFKKCSE